MGYSAIIEPSGDMVTEPFTHTESLSRIKSDLSVGTYKLFIQSGPFTDNQVNQLQGTLAIAGGTNDDGIVCDNVDEFLAWQDKYGIYDNSLAGEVMV